VEQARIASAVVSAREKKFPASTGVVPVACMVARFTLSDGLTPTKRPPAPMVIFTVLRVGSPTVSRMQVATPAARFVHEVNVNVPGN
jgi:hypothetical protein